MKTKMIKKISEIEIEDITFLKKIIKEITKISDNLEIELNQKNQTFYCIIRSQNNDILVKAYLDNNYFNYITCQQKKIKIFVNSNDLYQILKLSNNKKICFSISEEKNLHIKMDNQSEDYILNHITFQFEDVKTGIFYHQISYMTNSEFNEFCHGVNKNYDYLEMKSIENKIMMFGYKNYVLNKTRIKNRTIIQQFNESNFEKPTALISNKYKLSDFHNLNKYCKLSNKVDLYLRNDLPLSIKAFCNKNCNITVSIKCVEIFEKTPSSLFEICFSFLFKNSCQYEINKTINEKFNHIPHCIQKIKYYKFKPELLYLHSIKFYLVFH